jgi:Metallo-peptidase family M12/PA14 domain/Bacterial Ig domain
LDVHERNAVLDRLSRNFGMILLACLGVTAVAGPGDVEFDRTGLSGLANGEHVLVEEFPLGRAGKVTLDLERFSVLSADGRVVEGTAAGDRVMPPSELVMLKGTIVGEDEDSTVYLSVGRWGTQGFVSRAGEMYSISSGPYVGLLGPERAVRVTSSLDLADLPAVTCGWTPDDPALNPPYADDGVAEPMAALTSRGTDCSLAIIAIDTDYEFTANLFGGNTEAAADYALTLFGAVSTVYERDVGVALSVGFLRVWGEDVDFYGNEDIGGFLDKLRVVWRASMGDVPRVITHGLSGRPLGGGVAYVNVLCSTDWGYGISANIAGSFPYPLGDHAGGNWDPFVVAHETGHNFGTGHTHDSYDPVIDGCGLGDCSSAWGGTIMSYCHTCAGGMANIVMAYHPRVQAVIEATVAASSCLSDVPGGATAINDRTETIAGVPVMIDVLLNDIDQSCGVPTILSADAVSAGGGLVEIVVGGERDRIRLTPAGGFSGEDSFAYTVSGGASATVTVGVHTLRQPDAPTNPLSGASVAYYLLSAPTALPEFDLLTPYLSSVVPAVDFEETDGIFATSALANNVGAVFEGFVAVAIPGLFTFELESDEGSRLFVGGELVVDHDGLHAMESRQGVVGLLPGLHRVRVEYFEAGGSAGLIVGNAPMGLTPTAIPASAWFHTVAPPCPPDLTGDGMLDFFDLQVFLNAYAAGDLTADWTGDGLIDFFDVQGFLAEFAAGCP